MKEYGPIHTLWAESEEGLAEALSGVASCLARCSTATERHLSRLPEALLPVVHEYVLYGETLMVSAPNYTCTLVPDLVRGFLKAVPTPGFAPLSSRRCGRLRVQIHPVYVFTAPMNG